MTEGGPAWEFLQGRAEAPPAVALLGWQLLALDAEAGTLEAAFTATGQFLNSVGIVQGGILAAMLDASLGFALLATLGHEEFAPTLDLQVQFLKSVRPGRVTGHGRVVRRTSAVGFLAGELTDATGAVAATATATALIRKQVN